MIQALEETKAALILTRIQKTKSEAIIINEFQSEAQVMPYQSRRIASRYQMW